jgi:hypothetical protein
MEAEALSEGESLLLNDNCLSNFCRGAWQTNLEYLGNYLPPPPPLLLNFQEILADKWYHSVNKTYALENRACRLFD